MEVENAKEAVKSHQPEEDSSSDEVMVEEESSLKRRATFPGNAANEVKGNGNGSISTLTTQGSSASESSTENASWAAGDEFDSAPKSSDSTTAVEPIVPEKVTWEDEDDEHKPPAQPPQEEVVDDASWDTSLEFDSASKSKTSNAESVIPEELAGDEENSEQKPPPPPPQEEVDDAQWDTSLEFDSALKSKNSTVESVIPEEVAGDEENGDQKPPPPEEEEVEEDASLDTGVVFDSASNSNTTIVAPIVTEEVSGQDETVDQKPPPLSEVQDSSWDSNSEFDSASKSTTTATEKDIITEEVAWVNENDDQNPPPEKLEVTAEEKREVGGSSYSKREDEQIAVKRQQGTHDEIDWSQLNVKREDLAAKLKDVDIDQLISKAFDWKQADVKQVEYRELEGSTSVDINLKEGERVIYEMEESDEEVVELEFERAFEKIHTHDGYNMYCPNCSSQITRVVLRRKIRQRKILVASEKGRQNLLGCLSCFSVFIPSGEKLNPFRIFGHGRERDQTVLLQEEQLPTSDVPAPTPDEAVPVPPPAPVPVPVSTEAEGKRFDCFWFFKKKRAREDDLTTPLIPAQEPEPKPEPEPEPAPATATTTVSSTVYTTETREETIVKTPEETFEIPQKQPTAEETIEIPQEQQQLTIETAKTTEKGFDLFWFFKRRRVEETDLTTPLIPAASQVPSTTTMFTSTTTTFTSETTDESIKPVTSPPAKATPTEIQTTTTTVTSETIDEAIKTFTPEAIQTTTTVTFKPNDEANDQEDGAKQLEEGLPGDFKETFVDNKVVTTTTIEEKTVWKVEGTAAAAAAAAAAAVASAAAAVEKVTQTTPPGSVLDGNMIIDVREKHEEFIQAPKTPAQPELEVKQEYQPPGDVRIPIGEAPSVTEIPTSADTVIAVTTTTEIIIESRPPVLLDILKSIVYGGLMESIISLVIVSIAVALNSITMNVVAIGVACLVGGFFLLIHNLSVLRYGHPTQTNDQRYYDHLGRKELFPLHVVVAVISYIIFGLLPPVLFRFTFRATDDHEFKMISVAGAAFLSISVLAIAQTYVRGERTFSAYFKTVLYYVILAAIAAAAAFGIGYMVKDPSPCPTVLAEL